ncbi:hypothetical protein [Terriglobus saanensis]|uniref:Cna B domain protein n=1 Tax=Terriglobus saanensis (strain ATCC BAA-1853 / DSM 23119 / SP1PR4) TaxID=401053 RepID=E8V623_TERSS|nr:hypothetical protein [Terriglobus saanensis]ADV83841.1 hypothetical protein AciPR4_3082 [Terriglobus saanensis SP1PR4]
MRRLLMVFFLGAMTVEAQQAGQPGPTIALQARPQPEAGGGTVVGHVYCGDTHAPAHLAHVSLSPVPQVGSQGGGRFGGGMVTADMDGAFLIQGVAPGSYYVNVQMPGYVSPLQSVASADLTDSSADAQLRVRQKVQMVTLSGAESVRVDVTVDRGSAISGVVRFDDGTPAANVFVSVYTPPVATATNATTVTSASQFGRGGLGTGGVRGSGSTQTDDRGVFRIAGLPPGDYMVSANVVLPAAATPAPAPTSGGGRTFNPGTNLIVYAPATLHRSGATTFTLGSGDEHNGVEITVSLRGLHVVSGHLSGSTDDGGRRRVVLHDTGDVAFSRNALVAADGSFRMEEVPDGDYTITVAGGGTVGTATGIGVAVHGGDVTDVVLTQ